MSGLFQDISPETFIENLKKEKSSLAKREEVTNFISDMNKRLSEGAISPEAVQTELDSKKDSLTYEQSEPIGIHRAFTSEHHPELIHLLNGTYKVIDTTLSPEHFQHSLSVQTELISPLNNIFSASDVLGLAKGLATFSDKIKVNLCEESILKQNGVIADTHFNAWYNKNAKQTVFLPPETKKMFPLYNDAVDLYALSYSKENNSFSLHRIFHGGTAATPPEVSLVSDKISSLDTLTNIFIDEVHKVGLTNDDESFYINHTTSTLHAALASMSSQLISN